MADSIYQLRYWNLMKDFKVYVIYFHHYAVLSEGWDKTFNIFLAVTSCSSIAAWAIWQKHQMVWAVIIAASQVITAIKPFLPYNQRIKAISELNDRMQELFLECEKNWFSIAEGELTEKEIHDLYINLRDKSLGAEKKSLKRLVLPKKEKILKSAENEADRYFQTNYHLGAEYEQQQ